MLERWNGPLQCTRRIDGSCVIQSVFILSCHQVSGAYLVLKEWVFPKTA